MKNFLKIRKNIDGKNFLSHSSRNSSFVGKKKQTSNQTSSSLEKPPDKFRIFKLLEKDDFKFVYILSNWAVELMISVLGDFG